MAHKTSENSFNNTEPNRISTFSQCGEYYDHHKFRPELLLKKPGTSNGSRTGHKRKTGF